MTRNYNFNLKAKQNYIILRLSDFSYDQIFELVRLILGFYGKRLLNNELYLFFNYRRK